MASAQLPGKKEIEFEVKKVYGLNSTYSDFSPVLYQQQIIFASDREYNFNSFGEGNWEHSKHINLFRAEFKNNTNDSMVFNKVKIFDHTFLSDDHVGPICFNQDGTEAIFSQVSHRKQPVFGKVKYRPQLYSAKLVNGKWKEVEKLPFVKVNYSYAQPALSTDGKKLYFASDAIGGEGGKDIFVSERTESGWSEPKPLSVNTSGDEVFPTILGNTLYFSTTGRQGNGGLDLYKSELKNGEWGEPEWLGPTINSSEDDFGMVFNPNKISGYFSSNRANGEGEDDIYYFNLIEKVTLEDNFIAGQFTYRRLNGENADGLEVLLVDDEGNIVMRTTTDENGEFVFKNIDFNEKYTIKLGEEDDEVLLTLFGKDSNSFLISNKDGEFVYRKLSKDKVGTMALLEDEDFDLETGKGTLNGQFVYERLDGSPSDMEVLLVDEDGNIVMRTKTDEYGNFQFKNIPSDKNYLVKIEDDEDIGLLIFDKDDNVVATLSKDETGEFVYRRLDLDNARDIDLLTDDESQLVFTKKRMAITGEFDYSRLNGEKPESLPFEILDGEGNLIIRGKANKDGYFSYNNLPIKKELVFKLDDDSPYLETDLGLIILSRTHDVVIVLNKDENGYFVYHRLSGDTSAVTMLDGGEDPDLQIRDGNNGGNQSGGNDGANGESGNGSQQSGGSQGELGNGTVVHNALPALHTIYYKRGKSSIKYSDFKKLDEVAKALKNDPKLVIEISSHASAIASEEFNQELSERRLRKIVEYLNEKGVSSSQIKGSAYGESMLVNKCKTEDCPDSEHRANRRTELRWGN